jgi:hypothetical protein
MLAEAILRKDGGGRFCAFFAGGQAKGTVNPSIDGLALGTKLRDIGHREGAATLRPDVA